MNPALLIGRLAQRNIQLVLDGDRLRCRAPVGALDDTDREAIKVSKDALTAYLQRKRDLQDRFDEAMSDWGKTRKFSKAWKKAGADALKLAQELDGMTYEERKAKEASRAA